MSIEAMAWAFRQTIPNPGAKLVLLALCDYADESWSCFPGQQTLADKTSQGERTVRRHLDWLEQQGFINSKARFAHGRRTSNRYTLHAPRPSAPPPPPPATERPQPDASGGSGELGAEPDEPASHEGGPADDEPSPETPPDTGDTRPEQEAKMADGQNDHRPDHAEEPANLAGEPSENHQQKEPLPQAGADSDGSNRPGGCTAHPQQPHANCRSCGTNPRARQDAARRRAAERDHQDTQLWLQSMRVRRGQVERQERDGTLAASRLAARDAMRRARRDDIAPSTSDKETLTVNGHD